jgi:hypothetical protein
VSLLIDLKFLIWPDVIFKDYLLNTLSNVNINMQTAICKLLRLLCQATAIYQTTKQVKPKKTTELWKSKIIQILRVFRRLIPQLLDKSLLVILFCTAVCFLPAYREDRFLYVEAMEIIFELSQHLFFTKVLNLNYWFCNFLLEVF